jgi:ubiquinone/menaquinone biosynthesis C-methylase UbiE
MLYKTVADAVLDVAPAHVQGRANPSALDLGCGSGEFLAALGAAVQGKVALHGLDASPELLARGRERYPDIEFIQGDLRHARERCGERSFDAVFLLGTHSIFDDVDSWLHAVVAVTAHGGAAYILGLFNPDNFDTVIKWRRSSERDWSIGGYNCWSIETVSSSLKRLECAYEFRKVLFDTSFIDSLDPGYAMTFRRARLDDGAEHVVNGLQLFCNYYLLIIRPGEASQRLSAPRPAWPLRRRLSRLSQFLRSRLSSYISSAAGKIASRSARRDGA